MSLLDLEGPRYASFPTGAKFDTTWGFGHLGRSSPCIGTVSWELGRDEPEDALRGWLGRTRTDAFEDALLLAAVNDESEPMHPMLTWWTLLFALSIFARYHPTLWVSALDPDRSKLAVPLQALLDIAPDVVASLVWEAVVPHEPTLLLIHSSPWTRLSDEEVAELDALDAARGRGSDGLRTT